LPAQVRLTFGETVVLPPSALRVFDPDGIEVDDGRSDHAGASGATVGIGIRPNSKQGSYTVAWRVISSDTHPVSGAFTFSVGHPSATSAAPAAPGGGSLTVGVLYGFVRALAYAAYAALVGAVAFLLWCWPSGWRGLVGPRVAIAGWATLVATTVATLLLQGPYGDGTGLGSVFEPGAVATTLELPLGGALVARLLLLAATAVYLGHLTHRLPTAGAQHRRWLTVLGSVVAIGLAATWSVSGHAEVGLQAEVALPVDVAHLVAMAVWLGGLTVLTLTLRQAPTEPDHRQDLGAAVARFSQIALGCVVVLTCTGAYQAWRQLGAWTAFLGTDYGRVLLAKLMAVGVLLSVAALSRRAVHRMRDPVACDRRPILVTTAFSPTERGPRPATRYVPDPSLGRTVLIETVIAALVLGLTAILVNAEPGRTAQAAAAADARAPIQATVPYDTRGSGGTGRLDIQLNPARTGPNSLDITVQSPSGVNIDVPELDIELSLPDHHLGPLPITLNHQGPGRYHGSGQIPFPGVWQLAATVRTSDIDETTVRLPLNIHQ
jgi:copper transport protein